MSLAHFCAQCGHSLRPGKDTNCPAGDAECVDCHCPRCGANYEVHFDGCVVRDARREFVQRMNLLENLVKALSDDPCPSLPTSVYAALEALEKSR